MKHNGTLLKPQPYYIYSFLKVYNNNNNNYSYENFKNIKILKRILLMFDIKIRFKLYSVFIIRYQNFLTLTLCNILY